MAQPFLITMEHSEWHPPEVIRRRIPKRPLGRLESDPRFTPRQPVLSSRTLDIDKSGSRTYRAKSTSAIIEEQHQLLHDVYVNTRAASKTASGRKTAQTQTNNQQQQDPKRRRFLTINGSSPQRPWTSVERPKSVKKTDGQKKRPHTTTGRQTGPRGPATDTHLRLEFDPGVQASTHALHKVQRQVRELWQPENHRLEEGVFVRGRGSDLGGPDTRSGTWLNFSGGGDDVDAGLVQAFTSAMRNRGGEFYTIDGTVGTHVARQLRRGDRVRVGINGQVQSNTLRVKRWRKDVHNKETSPDCIEECPSEEEVEASPAEPAPGTLPPPIPLCWADQVNQSEKVLEARVPTKPTPKKNLCETRPVIFERLLAEDPLGRHYTSLRNTSSGGSGFAVRTRTKSRVGIDGSTTQNMTHLRIAPEVEEDDPDAMSVDDILERQLGGRDLKQPERKRPDLAIPNLTNIKTHSDSKAANSKPRALHTPPTSARSGKAEVPSPPPSRAAGGTPWSMTGDNTGDNRSVRPLTAHSAYSIDQNIDSFVVTASNPTTAGSPTKPGSAATTKPGSARSGGRATSGKRPPPAKPMLHKSAAAMGASIGGGGNNKTETSYIQITQSIASPQQQAEAARQQERGEPQGIPPPTPASLDGLSMDAASLCEQDLNPDEFPELDSDMGDMPDDDMEPWDTAPEGESPTRGGNDAASPVGTGTELPPEGSLQGRYSRQEEPLIEETEPEEGCDQEVPTSARSRGSDIRYAFDIPTAASEVEDEDDEGGLMTDRQQSLHDKLVEQTADLLAGAIIGADLPADLRQ